MKKSIATVCLALCVAGCAQSQSSLYDNPALYYPECYEPLHQARQLDSTARNVASGAGKGLLAGTLAGLASGAVSALFTGNALNIVSGAAMGAAGGAVAGGLYGGMNNNNAQKQALIAQWSQETGENLAGLGFTGAAATASLQCYNKRMGELDEEIAKGIVPSSVSAPRMEEIEMGRQEAAALLQGSRR